MKINHFDFEYAGCPGFSISIIINFVKMLLKTFVYRNQGNEEKKKKKKEKISRVQLNSSPPRNLLDVFCIWLGSARGL